MGNMDTNNDLVIQPKGLLQLLPGLYHRLNVDILCSWDTPPTGQEVEATESVWYQL